jgi:hypothetical protein
MILGSSEPLRSASVVGASQLFRWERPSKDEESELAAHRARIAAEEARAVGYKRKYF